MMSTSLSSESSDSSAADCHVYHSCVIPTAVLYSSYCTNVTLPLRVANLKLPADSLRRGLLL